MNVPNPIFGQLEGLWELSVGKVCRYMIGINLGPTITYLQSGSPELELGFFGLAFGLGWLE